MGEGLAGMRTKVEKGRALGLWRGTPAGQAQTAATAIPLGSFKPLACPCAQEHEHLIALGLRYADKQKLHDLTTRVAALKYGRSKTSPGQQAQARWGKQRG